MLKKLIARADISLRSNKMVKRGMQKRGEIELNLLNILTTPGKRNLDVGANKGVYTYQLQKHGAVTSFEPIPQLAGNIRLADFANVTIEECGIDDHMGSATLSVPHHKRKIGALNFPAATLRYVHATDCDQIAVDVKTLDSFEYDDIGFIKVDAEGWEENVVRGCEQTLARCQPVIMVELVDYVAPGCLVDVPNQLAALGYTGFFIDHEKRQARPLSELDPQNPQAQNFIFTPKNQTDVLAKNCTDALQKL